ncbi:2-dehydro-3-deoxy-D-gluconate 5-dehydrogenase KduD [Psychrosphaera sp. B3R10]|uniref:2-dehydro-3-deoxy-D-gluconate 5-dehydrogenase KduD n=1 Tax=unclassified Psychrosphaera TaxID=2641570 RepID=UPI001C0A55B8|nr:MULTISPECIES: 2-dehydro-3-deoxy-D-gluconate 5-dehydrogenase KduD [unclassified Psychrosphaera]MBU2883551.1 2-dehydro-3-deoxy-D-gluconate 5-dehydrogenase KduD [Psychrosphaera sp. I2R16]MBU2989730.1 2-dehydro-3-deoxy-D-gluconate 5-dehydrogenase KduD [Psychrosphaera sp. B3R10]
MQDFLKQQFGLEGKVAIVTGATRGLGQAMAIALGEAGATVVAVGSKPENVANTIKLLEAKGIKHLALGCDQSNKAQIIDVVEDTLKAFGKIDILVNNAGTIKRSPAHEFTDEDWDDVIEVNLNGVFRFCREVGKHMLKQGSGKIINIASLLSFSGGITVPAYAASKGGVAQLTKALANEWAASGIQVNAIAPGYFETDNTYNLRQDKERHASITARIPAGEWGKPEDLTGPAIFLSSSAANYMNGHVMLVDGGWMAR